MKEFTPLQIQLMRLRDERCGGNAAELARRIEKDATYVNRLFYPAGKAGAKGIGMEIIAACNKAFDLPPGYWEGVSAYWPFSDELQQAVAALDTPAKLRLENVIRAHLGLEVLAVQREEIQKTVSLRSSLRQTIPTGSAARGGLAVVQPDNRPVPQTPALDAEDARQRRQESYGSRTTGSPTGPKDKGDPR